MKSFYPKKLHYKHFCALEDKDEMSLKASKSLLFLHRHLIAHCWKFTLNAKTYIILAFDVVTSKLYLT